MRNHVEHGSRSGSAALGACFKIHALITAAILIVGVFGASEIAWAQGQPIIFSAVGDVPYSDNEKPEFQQHMDNHDLYSPAEFLVHLGDIMPQSTCDESWYSWMRAALRSLSVPAFIVPGDNEWSDCNNPPPSQAWTYWVTHLLAVEQGMCGLPLIERQAVRTENFAFVKKGVLFIGINMVSGGLGSSEEETRGQQDADWVRYQFQTKGSTVRAAVIFAQASPRDPFETQFRSDAVAFAKPVLYIHGDGHSWVYNHPYLESNITRVMVERGDANHPPVAVTVTMDPVNPFLFNQDPWPTGTPPLNRAPCADAGADLEGTLANGVMLQGRVSDDGEPISANLTFGWSQVSGPGIVSFTNADALTTQAHFSTAGIYQLRLTASDGALVGSDTVSVNVQVVLNAAPVLDIIGPDTGSSVDESATVTFMGWAYDIEDGDLTSSLRWTSSRDGLIGMGGQFSTSGLSIGVHSITASITDTGGKTSSQVIGLTIVGSPSGPTTVEVRVNTSADDAEESTTGSMSLNSSDLELVLDSSNQTVGMRFPVVAVPRYAVIGNAWIQFEADRTGSVATSLTVQGQAADSASAFTTATANLSSRPKTTGAVAWSPVPWNSAGAAGPEQRTPNLSSVIQEIVNRPGWSTGNSLAIFITGTGQRAAQSYDGSSAGAPLLHVEFVPGQAPPVVNAGPDQAINLPNVAVLDAMVTDDGLPNPPGSVTTTWSQLSGTGTATFGNPHAIDTTVSFSGPATYVLRLTAVDGGAFVVSDDVTITVTLAGEIDVTPTTADYGLVVAGTTSLARTFTVTNQGIGNLIVGASTLTGPDAGSFAFVSGQAGFTIAPGGSGTLQVRFAPLTGGPKLATLSIPSNDPNESPFLITLTGIASVTSTPTFMEVQQGGSSLVTVTTSANLTGMSGHLYLAAVSTTPPRTVNTVAGLSLAWTRLAAQCGGRNQTGVELWWAQGAAATTGTVTATLATAATNTVITVSRYSNVPASNPVGLLVAGNTNGVSGACAAGVDSAAYSLGVTTTLNQALVVGAVAKMNRTHTAGSGYTERVEVNRGSGTTAAAAALVDRSVPVAMSLPLNGSLSGVVDWAVIGAEVRPSTTLPMPDIDVAPTTHSYGVVPIGSTATRTFVIRNLGTANLQVTGSTLVGGQAGEFAVTIGGAPFTLTPGATRNLDVRFTPSGGLKTTTLRLTSMDSDEGVVDVALSGTGVVPIPEISVAPLSHDFGAQRVGVTVIQSFTVSNIGTGNLVVGAPVLVGTEVASFTVVNGQAGFTIPPGATGTIDVRFLPLWGGAKSATLIIPSDDTDETASFVSLSGSAVVTTTPTFEEIQQGGSSTISVTTASSLTGITGHLYLAAVSTRPRVAVNTMTGLGLTWTRVAAQCAGLSQTGIELWWAKGNASTGTVTATLATVPTNAVITAARYSGVAATNPVLSLVAANTNGMGGACTGGIASATYSLNVTTTVNETMVVGAVARLDRTHTPGVGYTQRLQATQGSGLDIAGIAFVDRTVPTISTVPLNGTLSGTADWAVAGIELRPSTSGPIPGLTVVPNPHHDYGSVVITQTATKTFAITNSGTANVQVTGSTLVGGQAAQFAITLGGAPFTLLPGGTHNLDVRFAPTSEGSKATTLLLKSSDPYQYPFDVTLSGTGLPAADIDVLPTTHNFGVVWFGSTPTQTFAIRNLGNLNLQVTSATLIGAQATEFAITLGGAPLVVAPGATHTLAVRYAPTLVGPNTTTLRLTTNDPDEPTVDVILNGTGIAPPDVEITPTPYDFGQVLVGTPEVTVGTTATRTFVIRNLGSADLQVTASSLVGGQAVEFAITLGAAPFTLAAGATRNLDVRFAPTSGGPKATTLQLTNNDPDEALLNVALTGTATTAPEIDVVPATHNYGVIWVGANASRTFTIRNVGSANLNVSAASLIGSTDFAIISGGAPFTVMPGATYALSVQFAPSSSGPKTTTLRLTSDDVDESTFNVALNGTGTLPPDVDIAPTPYDFGSVLVGTPDVVVGTTATRTFVIRSLGEVALQVTTTSLVGGQTSEFAITLGGGPFTLPAGGTRNLDVRFTPTSGGPKATTLRLTSNDPDETPLDVALTATATTAPEIDVVPATHNYGVVWVNATGSRTFTIRNVGTANLSVSAVSPVTGESGQFAVTSGGAPFTVLPGATHNLSVQFAPSSSGPKATTLQLTSNDLDEATFNVALSGTGIMPPDVDITPTPYNFGLVLVGTAEVTVGTTSTRTFAIRNLGEADLHVTGSSLVGGQVGEFAITAGGAPFTVSGGATRNLDVRFAPTSAGLKTTTLRLTSNDPDEAPLDLALSGTGTTAPEISVTPNPYDYGLVVLGVPATRTFAIRNVGSADLHVSNSSLDGGQVGEFAIVAGGGPFTLAPGATHNLNVRFDPMTIGPKATTLRLTSDDQDESVLDVALSGTGKILIPDIHVTPASHDYGLRSIGTSVTQAFTVSNTGDGDVVVGTSTLSGPDVGAFAFVSGKNGFTIVPGGSNVIEVRFNAPTEGTQTATLTIPSNDPDENPISIQLTGTGGPIAPPTFMEVKTGGSSSTNVTTSTSLTGVTGDLYLAAVSTRPYRAVTTVTGLGLTWTRLAAQCGGRNLTGVELWWAQGIAATGTVRATLVSTPTNAVIAVTRYSGVAPTNPVAPLVRGNTVGVNGACSGGTDSAAYSFDVTTTSIQSLVIGAVAVRHRTHTPGAGYTERVEVGRGSTTSRAGIALVELAVPDTTTLALNGTLSNTVDWAVIGAQVRPNNGVPIADIEVEPNPEHDYGDVFVGATATQTFAINNLGGADLQVSANTLIGAEAGEFEIALGGAPFTVAPGATHNVDVQFAPISGGPKTATLRLTSDDPDENAIDVALSGNGINAPEIDVVPAANNYGVIWLGQNASRTFAIRNIGSADLQITTTSLVGADVSEFGITSGGGSFTLVPGATRDVDVRFAPTSVGAKTAALRLASNDGNEATFDVSLSGTGTTPPDIATTPSAHNYGDVLITTNTSRTFVITNAGGADLQITGSTLVGGQAVEFAITSGGAPFTLAAGATRNLDVRFAPTSAGAKGTTLRLTGNDPDESPLDVALSGMGTTAPELDVVPTAHNYGVIWVGANGSRTFAIRNIGSADLQVTATSLVGSAAGEFGITLGGGAFTVAPGATHNLDLQFAPTSAGPKTATLRLMSNDQDEATFDVALSGNGIMPPDITIAPSPYDYGDVLVGTNATRTFVITNTGGADLQVTASTLVGGQAGEFAITAGGAPFTLATGSSRNLEVRFTPTSGGLKGTALRLTGNDPDESPIDISLSGTATTAPEIDVSPTTQSYGLVVTATTSSRTFAVRNMGSANLQVAGAILIGGESAEFAITSGGAPFTVAPGATHNLVVGFTPTSTGPKATTLRLTSDDQNEPNVDVPLSGTGTILAPEISVTPASHNYGTQGVGTNVTQSFTISNTGTGDLVVNASTLTGPDANMFAFASGQAGFTIAAGASNDVQVRFSPTTEGLKSATLTIPSNDADENPIVVALSGTGGPATPPTFIDMRQGGSTNLSTVSTATAVTGVTGHLYLAAISAKTHRQVTAVTGLGLTWTRLAAQCAGRGQTGLELWWAQGAATTGTVTATLASAPVNALIVVARYSGVAVTNPVASLVAGNSNGVNGACANGIDSAAYSFNVTTTQANALVFGAVAIRTRTHTPGPGYVERGEMVQGSAGDMVTIALLDRAVPTAAPLPLNGTLSGAVDWAVIAVQLRP